MTRTTPACAAGYEESTGGFCLDNSPNLASSMTALYDKTSGIVGDFKAAVADRELRVQGGDVVKALRALVNA